ncbi:hypothetical protein pb186bvf_019702 [Paramecium bursaria]
MRLYILPFIYALIITFQVLQNYGKILQKFDAQIFINTVIILKLLTIWASINQYSQFMNYSMIILQLFFTYQKQIRLKSLQTLILISGMLNVYNINLRNEFDTTKIILIMQFMISACWIQYLLPKFKDSPIILIEPRTQLSIFGVNETTRRSELLSIERNISLNKKEPWLQLTYLMEEKILVLDDKLDLKYLNFDLNILRQGDSQSIETEDQLVSLLIEQQIKLEQKFIQSQFKISSSASKSPNNQIKFKSLLERILSQSNREYQFTSIVVQMKEFDLQNHMINIFVKIDAQKPLIILHFQKTPKVYNNHENLHDICKSLSHELSTNLNCMTSLSNVGIMDPTIQESIKNEYLKPIYINSEQLNLIISNFRDYGTMESDQFQLKLETFNLNQQIQEIVDYFQDTCKAKMIQIEFLCDDQISVANDKYRFRQIFYQLLSNSIRYTYQGKIDIILQQLLGSLSVTIKDTGIGINKEEQKNLFKLLNSNTLIKVSKSSVGSGLGLFISNQIVKKMNCDEKLSIQFESEHMGGSEFSFLVKDMQSQINIMQQTKQKTIIKFNSLNSYIENSFEQRYPRSPKQQNSNILLSPKQKEDDNISVLSSEFQIIGKKIQSLNQQHQKPKFQNYISIYSLKSNCCTRVLIVDDEYFNIVSLQSILGRFKTLCDQAFNGEEAIKMVNEKLLNKCLQCGNNCYQIIFLDINMPIKDGLETVIELKQMMENEIIRRAWFIANTAFCDVETKITSYDSGMDFFLTKPISFKDLSIILMKIFPYG